jgi:calcineurin-like phosphoesterase
MRLLFLGDMVGRTGRTAVWEQLPGLIGDFRLDFVIVNGENAAGGFGITGKFSARRSRRGPTS